MSDCPGLDDDGEILKRRTVFCGEKGGNSCMKNGAGQKEAIHRAHGRVAAKKGILFEVITGGFVNNSPHCAVGDDGGFVLHYLMRLQQINSPETLKCGLAPCISGRPFIGMNRSAEYQKEQ